MNRCPLSTQIEKEGRTRNAFKYQQKSKALEFIILDEFTKANDKSISSIYSNYSNTNIENDKFGEKAQNTSILHNIDTPQGKAFDWLVNFDQYDILKDSLENENIIQRYILAVLFFSTEGQYNQNIGVRFTPQANIFAIWTSHGHLGFLSKTHECQWNVRYEKKVFGVTCENWKVSGFHFEGVGLDGYIPEEIGVLSDLKTINFRDNYLTGTIPRSLGSIHGLKHLNLARNRLTGPVPDLGPLMHLETFYLHSNRIHGGSISLSMCKMFDTGSLNDLWADCAQRKDPLKCHCCTYCCDASIEDCVHGGNSKESTNIE